MSNRKALPLITSAILLAFAATPSSSLRVYAGGAETITDELDSISDGRVAADVYNMAIQSGDVGFGTDSRVVSSYQATAAPTTDTMWSDYGYIQCDVSGQNTLTVVCDESTDVGAPLVWEGATSALLSAGDTETETSTNWTRRSYIYTLPDSATWVRIIPVAYDASDGSMSYWSQQITRVVLEEKTEASTSESTEVPTIDDPFTASGYIADDAYGIAQQTGDVGFGEDVRYYSTKAVAAPCDSTNWWDGRAYLQYTLGGQNLATVVVDIDPNLVSLLPHPALVANFGGNNSVLVELNNYSIETSTNWSRITYKYIVDTTAQWARVVFNSYDSYDGRITTAAPQLTEVKFEKVDALPAKDDDIPTIEVIEKPTPEEIEVVDDPCEELDGAVNAHIHDHYSSTTSKHGDDGVFVTTAPATTEPTASTWWESYYGYVEFSVDSQNLLSVRCYVSDYAVDHTQGILVYAGVFPSLTQVALNNRALGTSADGYTEVTYQYILPSGINVARLVFANYIAPDGAINRDSILMTNVRIEYSDTLPDATPEDTSHDEQKAKLDEYLATLAKEDYSDDSWALINYYILMGKYDLMLTDSEDEANSVIEAVKAKIAAVKTIAQELEEAKETEKKRIADFVATLNEDDYTEENWAKIQKYVSDAYADIDAQTDTDAIKQIADDTIADIQAVPVKEVPVPSSSEASTSSSEAADSSAGTTSQGGTEEGHGGCGGALAGGVGISAFFVFAAAGIALSRKKKR